MAAARAGCSRCCNPATASAPPGAPASTSLGAFAVEPLESVAARLMGSGLALYGMSHLAGLLRLLSERDPHPELFEAASLLIDHLHDPDIAPPLMVRFELAILAQLGFGLDLSACAATGATTP